MDQELLRNIADQYLVPFFSGASLKPDSEDSSLTDDLVTLLGDNDITFKANPEDDYKLVLTRRQSFSKEKDVIPETSVVQAFVEAISQMGNALTGPFKEDLLSAFQRRVVAKAIAGAPGDEEILLKAIDQLAAWANRLYEGSPIAAAIGFRNKPQDTDAITLQQLHREDFGLVISNGFDTLLEFDFSGRFIRHLALKAGDKPPQFCPYRQAPIAEWTTKSERRVGLVLNRLGEILVFRNQQLLFARRSGIWSYLTHRPVITQMGPSIERSLREAIYISCIDASFARTGACIGVVNELQDLDGILSESDNLETGRSAKVKVITKIIRDRNFRHLDRRLRQELLAVDGATVLSNDGDVLAVGSILKIPGGSTGGGRLAAAQALGKLGLGIKVSQDGGITGYRPTLLTQPFELCRRRFTD